MFLNVTTSSTSQKRLLFNKSSSDDAERSMITKLKVECGCQFTTKFEGMFNDMRMASDTLAHYKEYVANSVCLIVNACGIHVF